MTDFIFKTLNTRIAPMVYIMMFVSVIIGFSFATGLGMDNAESILYGTGVLVDRQAWGLVLFCTASTALAGMVAKNAAMIQLGGITGWMVWLFACIALALEAHWYVFLTVGMFHLLFHGYVYLASAIDILERQPRIRG